MHAAAHLGLLHHRYDRRRSDAAAQELSALLLEAGAKLRLLGGEPLCVLECPRRMNKGVADWRAVRVGEAAVYSCVGSRFPPPEMVWANTSDALRAANDVLQGLIDRGWRRLVFEAFELEASLVDGTALTLLIDEGKAMLALQLEYDPEGPVYEVGGARSFELIGVCERLGELDGIRPVEWLTADAWAVRAAQSR